MKVQKPPLSTKVSTWATKNLVGDGEEYTQLQQLIDAGEIEKAYNVVKQIRLEERDLSNSLKRMMDTVEIVYKQFIDWQYYLSKPGSVIEPKTWDEVPKFDLVLKTVEKWRESKRYSATSLLKVVDIGCYSGYMIRAFAACGYNCVGMDIQSNLMNYLNLKYKNIFFKALRAEEVDTYFKPDTLDVVLMLDTLTHVADPVAALAGALNILKKNGILVITVTTPYKNECCPDQERLRSYNELNIKALFNMCGIGLDDKGLEIHSFLDQYKHRTLLVTYQYSM